MQKIIVRGLASNGQETYRADVHADLSAFDAEDVGAVLITEEAIRACDKTDVVSIAINIIDEDGVWSEIFVLQASIRLTVILGKVVNIVIGPAKQKRPIVSRLPAPSLN